ncbi:hypothetical protein OK016_29745 [Vibrio chagasii]|nr:hypothetical protein [Vibrio chagasii]
MKSRQTYAYGVLCTTLLAISGMLAPSKQGAYYIIDQLEDKQTAALFGYTKEGKVGPDWQQRTSQDQARMVLVGLAMYYYLTQDKGRCQHSSPNKLLSLIDTT